MPQVPAIIPMKPKKPEPALIALNGVTIQVGDFVATAGLKRAGPTLQWGVLQIRQVIKLGSTQAHLTSVKHPATLTTPTDPQKMVVLARGFGNPPGVPVRG